MRAVFAARGGPRVIVVDKRGADGADAWNAALNVATEPLLLTLAPGVTHRDALVDAALPFALDATVIAAIGMVPPAGTVGRSDEEGRRQPPAVSRTLGVGAVASARRCR